jgi:hypothetical protein
MGIISMKHPTTRFCRCVCGAAIKVFLVGFVAIVSAACGGESAPTAGATPTPSPGSTPASITYRLTEGSTILFVPPTPPQPPTTPEPLSGTFTVVSAEHPPTPAPNDVFLLTITSLSFEAVSGVTLTGEQSSTFGCNAEAGVGCIEATTLDVRAFWSTTLMSADGEHVGLSGGGLWKNASLPTFQDVQLCGGPVDRAADCDAIRNGTVSGYVLSINAVPE